MEILDAQRDMRSAFLGGFVGQLISGIIWLVAAVLSVIASPGLWHGGAIFWQHVLIPA